MDNNHPSETMQIVSALIGLITTLFSGYMAYLMYKVKNSNQVIATETHEAKKELKNSNTVVAEKLDTAAQTADATLNTVASALLSQLHLNAVTTKRLAMQTLDKADLKAAEEAEKLYREQLAKQEATDASNKL